jgi:hypothetical protein
VKITIEPTDMIVDIDHVTARIWEGTTDDGVPVMCFITRISPQTHDEAVNRRFAAELQETRAPSLAAQVIPLRLIL